MKADDERMKLSVDRAYQEEKREYEKELEEARELKRNAESESRKMSEKVSILSTELKTMKKRDLQRKNINKLIKSLAWRVILSFLLSAILFKLAIWALPTKKEDILYYIDAVAALLIPLFLLILKPIKKYRESIKVIYAEL